MYSDSVIVVANNGILTYDALSIDLDNHGVFPFRKLNDKEEIIMEQAA